MTVIGHPLTSGENRGDWVRMRTLIVQRWIAIAGQVAAIIVADRLYGIDLPLGLCYLVVGASVVANVLSAFWFPDNARLTETQALLTLLFDMAQHSALIYLAGGLNNPFALLILAPVTISASALQLRTTLILGATAMAMMAVMLIDSIPLQFADGSFLMVPRVFLIGFWFAIVIGILFQGYYSRSVATEIRSMSDALLATQMALAREQKLTDLGGVVAAAAHEMGTPLATIKLVSTEMMADLADHPDLLDDAKLIREQADRCRDILRSMGKVGKDDKHMRQAALGVVLREAAEPHLNRGKRVAFDLRPGYGGSAREPMVLRRPEVIHALRNLVQNAVDFAESAVWVDASWTDKTITVRVVDNGPGYPPDVIGRIGDPFVRKRSTEQDLARRPEYEGMGLGLFIAKTLLERTGAVLVFSNGSDPFLRPQEVPERCGAVVEVSWHNEALLAPADQHLGENSPLEG